MSRRLTKRDLKQLDRDEFGTTSPVYRYIRDSYAELVGRKVGRPGGPSWESFAQLLTDRGQTNGKGDRLTADTARKLFRRVSREVEARPPHAPNRPAPAHRSRQGDDWRPPETAPTPLARPTPAQVSTTRAREPPASPTTSPSPGDGKKKITYDDLPPEAKAQFDQLREAFAETDRKRFGSF